MIKIAHLADIHIPNDPNEHVKFRIQFEKLYDELNKIKPDKIVLVGDTLDAFIQTTLEAETLAAEFLNKISKITNNVVATIGNHEIRKKDLKRKSSIGSIIEMIHNDKITLFDKSGFFEDKDEDIIWVNYSHLQKDIIPWKDIKHTKNESKTYIGLFHDPINGCKLPNGQTMENTKLIKLNDFKNNDLNLFGDIHLRQFLNKKTAYPGSLLQNTFGETVENHGFLLWCVDDKISVEEYNIQNDYTKITFHTKEDYDYDNIDFDHPLATEKSEFRVIWKDYSANINNENKEKIKKFIKDKWNVDEIIFEPQRIYTNVASSQKLTESINVNDKNVQQEIFKEYLKANKYDDNFIEEILKVDNIIDSRLELSNTINNIEWSIDKIWVNNFKSYESFELDWSNINGIIQLNGENQQGKTTVLDAITYITHGTTLSTHKLGGAQREKHGDNRYINNKRKENFCEGGMVIDINGEKYTLLRRTERKLGRDKVSISSVSTKVEYYTGVEINEDNKIVGEQKKDTQKKLDAVIGNFEDFIRLTLTNSENLNYLISLDRATFIDSIIKDAGYDIFEKKLKEFKEYKKSINSNNINININESEEKIKKLKEQLKTYKINNDVVKKEISDIDKKNKEINELRDVELKKLNKIDNEIADINIDDMNNRISEYNDAIETNISTQKNNSIKLKGLKTTYDKEKYESLLKSIKTIDDDILNLKLKISQKENNIEKEKLNIQRVFDKIEQLKEKEISEQKSKLFIINNDIDKIKNKFTKSLNNKIDKIKDQKKDKDFEIKSLNVELKNFKEKGLSIKSDIKELKETDDCPVCGASKEHQKTIQNKIDLLETEVNEILRVGKEKQKLLKIYQNESEDLQKQIDDLNSGTYPEDIIKIQHDINNMLEDKKDEISLINKICEEIKQDNYTHVSTLEQNINKGLIVKKQSDEKIIDIENEISDIKKTIKEKDTEKSNKQYEIIDIEKDKEEVNTYDYLKKENESLTLKIENIKLTIEKAKLTIDKYYNQLKYVEENKIIEKSIFEYDEKLKFNETNKTELNDKITEIMEEATYCKKSIKEIQDNIKIFLEQVKRDEILKEYQKCISRDGIPTFLLQKSKDLINVELEDMLTNVDFNVFFDDFLNLKMYMKNKPEAIINCIEGSGKERTFSAVSLKMALRTINNKSRPSILIFDEVMLKLKGKSVQQFNDMLESMKNKINKIVVIEHMHDIPFDLIINVSKDSAGISHLDVQ